MTTPDELLRLAERVEQGSGSDGYLLMAVLDAVNASDFYRDVLTSLDAVEALRQRMISECEIVSRRPTAHWPGWQCDMTVGGPVFNGEAPTEARARLAALLRAYAATVE